jgi:hypothetical protein
LRLLSAWYRSTPQPPKHSLSLEKARLERIHSAELTRSPGPVGTQNNGPNSFNFPTWGEDFLNNGGSDNPTFNGSPTGNFVATSFSFTYTGTQNLTFNTVFDSGVTREHGAPDFGGGWSDPVISSDGKTITFTATPGQDLMTGDQYDILVGFNQSTINLNTFAFTATWTGFEQVAAVPEPSTWAMMILGFCGVGFMTYRRRNPISTLTAA